MSKKPGLPFETRDIYIDDDGYVCFEMVSKSNPIDRVIWTLHSCGWEAFRGNAEEPIYSTDDVTYPTKDDLIDAWNQRGLIL